MILEMSAGRLTTRPVRVDNVQSLVVRDVNGTPVAVFCQMSPDVMTYTAASDPKFQELLASVGFIERVDVIRTSL